MNILTKDQFSELINRYKESFFVICAGNGVLKSNECAAYIAISQESAKKYFDSIVEQLPENMKEFSTPRMSNIENIYSFSGFFNQISFKYIYIVDLGIVEKGNFIKKNIENVEYVSERLKGFNDNDVIYSIYTKENIAFSPTEEFKQCFFSNTTEVKQFITQYNNENLGLYSSFFELDKVANGCINDLLNCYFDGKDCSGWDIVEAAYRIYNENCLNEEEVEKIVNDKKLAILVATDGSNYVMTQRNNAIFFTSNKQAENFLKRNKNNITHEFKLYTVENVETFEKLISNSRVIYIDGEKHSIPIDFLIGVGARKKWESIEEVKQKAISLWNKDKLYIILSINNANLQKNTSIPYVVDANPFYLWIFENYEDAKKFIDKNNKTKLNNKYPIGIIDNSKILWSLKTTLSIANALNIPDVEFNPDEYECIYFKIKELFEFNGEELSNNFSILTTKNAEAQNVQIHFNPFSFDEDE